MNNTQKNSSLTSKYNSSKMKRQLFKSVHQYYKWPGTENTGGYSL